MRNVVKHFGDHRVVYWGLPGARRVSITHEPTHRAVEVTAEDWQNVRKDYGDYAANYIFQRDARGKA